MSILASLEHAYTTPALSVLNRELDTVLLCCPVNHTLLKKIITKRANLVESLLNTLDEQPRRCFADCELKANDIIIRQVEAQRIITKSELATVNKASKAIKKYHQV